MVFTDGKKRRTFAFGDAARAFIIRAPSREIPFLPFKMSLSLAGGRGRHILDDFFCITP